MEGDPIVVIVSFEVPTKVVAASKRKGQLLGSAAELLEVRANLLG
jgi:hypothetical protein